MYVCVYMYVVLCMYVLHNMYVCIMYYVSMYVQVNNACATGSTALFMAKQFIEGGISECVLALGFEKMERGSLKSHVNHMYMDLHSLKSHGT